jgi:predicted Zn-dependent peptidase
MPIATLLLLLPLLMAAPAFGAGLHIPDYQVHTLDNGLTVQLMRMPTVPMVNFEWWISAGETSSPSGEDGLAALTAEALRRGSGELDATQFASAVDALGARFSTSVNSDRTRLSMQLLSADFDAGFQLLSDAVLHPHLEDGEVARLAHRMGEEVLQSKENPRFVIEDYHRANLFADHPYARPVDGTELSLPRLDGTDVRAFHRDHYGAQRSILTIVGDIDPDVAFARVRETLEAMPRSEKEAPQLQTPRTPERPRVVLVNKVDTPQTWFMIGTVGPSWTDRDDFAATEIVRTVFGGRFTSWLNSELRIKAGLTYGARYTMRRMKYGGLAAISTFTATETTREAIDLALATLDRLHSDGLSPEELASAKAYVRGQTPYQYETASDLAFAISQLAFYGVSREELDDLFERIDAVTLEDCRDAIDRWFSKENLVMTAVGVADEVSDILADYGDLTVRENDDPGFAPVPRAD